jgi:hypothetical protein
VEQDSFELDPMFFDPHNWRLLPDSAGYRTGPGGKDFGADVNRIATSREETTEASR